MVSSIKLVTWQKPSKKGYRIAVELFDVNNKRVLKTIGHSFIEHWNEELQEPNKQHPDYFELLPAIQLYHSKIAVANIGKHDFEKAYKIIFEEDTKQKQLENNNSKLLNFIDILIEERKSVGMATKKFKDIKLVIESYLGTSAQNLLINDINYEWLNQFMLYKLQNGTNKGGLRSYLQTLRTIYKEAQRRHSLNIKQDNPFLGLIKKAPPKPKPAQSITKQDLCKMLKFKPHQFTAHTRKAMMYRNIDLFFFQFVMGGMDLLFVALLEWKDIKENRLKFNRNKTRDKDEYYIEVDNFIPAPAYEAIYNHSTKDTPRVFSFIPHPYKEETAYMEWRNRYNRSLATICKTVGIPKVTSKSSRYIFRTFAGNKLVHDMIIKKLQGHQLEGTTYLYQGQLDKKMQDQIHLSIIDLA